MVEEIRKTLSERGNRYGHYHDNARVSQAIKEALRSGTSWELMDRNHRETVDMLAQKLCRIVNGDPNYDDNYRDIIGYCQLMLDIISQKLKHQQYIKDNFEEVLITPNKVSCMGKDYSIEEANKLAAMHQELDSNLKKAEEAGLMKVIGRHGGNA